MVVNGPGEARSADEYAAALAAIGLVAEQFGQLYRVAHLPRRVAGRNADAGQRIFAQLLVGHGHHQRAVHPAGVGDEDRTGPAHNGAQTVEFLSGFCCEHIRVCHCLFPLVYWLSGSLGDCRIRGNLKVT